MNIEMKIERPLILYKLALGDDNLFDSIDEAQGKELAHLFGYADRRFEVRFGIEEIGEDRVRVTISYLVAGFPKEPLIFAGSIGMAHKMRGGLTMSIWDDDENHDPLLTYYKLFIE